MTARKDNRNELHERAVAQAMVREKLQFEKQVANLHRLRLLRLARDNEARQESKGEAKMSKAKTIFKVVKEQFDKKYPITKAYKPKRKTSIDCFVQLLRPHWRNHWLPRSEEAMARHRFKEHRAKAKQLGVSYDVDFVQFKNLWVTTERFTKPL
jgi:hypothetical protein